MSMSKAYKQRDRARKRRIRRQMRKAKPFSSELPTNAQLMAKTAKHDDYDAAKDAHDSYYAAIEAKRLRGDAAK